MEKNILTLINLYFSDLVDPRVERTKIYPLLEILFLVISAVISGAENWDEIADFGEDELEWLRKYYPYKNGTASHDTINRVMSMIKPEEFGECFMNWVRSFTSLSSGSLISLDGKTIRGSKSIGKRAVHLVSAWSNEMSISLGQVKTEEKSNEITAIPKLLEVLEIESCVVSIDAMGCQKEIARMIKREKKADYLLSVKDNQKQLHKALQTSFEQESIESEDKTIEKNHGRLETRKCKVIHNLEQLPMAKDWEGISSLIQIQSTRELLATGKVEQNTRYYVASLRADAKQFNRLVRNHWGIENKLHWSLDVVFREDHSRKRQGAAAENFALICKVALNLLNQEETKMSKPRKRFKAARNSKYREKVLGIPEN